MKNPEILLEFNGFREYSPIIKVYIDNYHKSSILNAGEKNENTKRKTSPMGHR